MNSTEYYVLFNIIKNRNIKSIFYKWKRKINFLIKILLLYYKYEIQKDKYRK